VNSCVQIWLIINIRDLQNKIVMFYDMWAAMISDAVEHGLHFYTTVRCLSPTT
jgi:hypothetical protein